MKSHLSHKNTSYLVVLALLFTPILAFSHNQVPYKSFTFKFTFQKTSFQCPSGDVFCFNTKTTTENQWFLCEPFNRDFSDCIEIFPEAKNLDQLYGPSSDMIRRPLKVIYSNWDPSSISNQVSKIQLCNISSSYTAVDCIETLAVSKKEIIQFQEMLIGQIRTFQKIGLVQKERFEKKPDRQNENFAGLLSGAAVGSGTAGAICLYLSPSLVQLIPACGFFGAGLTIGGAAIGPAIPNLVVGRNSMLLNEDQIRNAILDLAKDYELLRLFHDSSRLGTLFPIPRRPSAPLKNTEWAFMQRTLKLIEQVHNYSLALKNNPK